MRLTSIAIIGSSLFALAAHAQPANEPAPVEQVTPEQAQPGAAPAADGVIHQWGPSAPIVQAAPAPAQSYPPCTNGRTDSCYNPDPSREADTKASERLAG